LGGIQPSIFNSFSTDENKENGFMDRMLLSFPESIVDHYNDAELEYDTIKWYSENITKFYQGIKSLIKRNEDGDIVPVRAKFTDEAKKEWIRIFNKITTSQNNEDENEYLKSMYPKQKSYIPRFALLLNSFQSFFDDVTPANEITVESILKAEKISDYFVSNARKIKLESSETNTIKQAIKKAETSTEKIKAIYSQDPNFNRTKVAELLGLTRQQVIRLVKKLDENDKEA
jgi:hypothetical protein